MRLWPRRQGSSLDLLVVGLGNPGREYARNRHNAGAMVVDELARRYGGAWRSKFSGQLAEIRLEGHKLALLKPETYMNESGRSVGAAARFFKVEPEAVTTGCARSSSTSSPRTSSACASASAARSAATRGRWPTGCSPTSPRTTTRKRSSHARLMRSRPSMRKASTGRRQRSTAADRF
jgi:hypothetical protein